MSNDSHKPHRFVSEDESTQEINPPKLTRQSKLVDWLYPSLDTVEKVWDSILAIIRLVLPKAWNQRLSDWALTGAIAAFIVVIMVMTVALTLNTPTQSAKDTPPEPMAEPSGLAAPDLAELELADTPSLELTPEQRLITAIQNQVTEITDHYANGLIESIQANFQQKRLIVQMSDGWYELDQQKQDNLADEIWLRSEELQLSKLEITHLDGTLLARSPVVGSQIVIWQRQKAPLISD